VPGDAAVHGGSAGAKRPHRRVVASAGQQSEHEAVGERGEGEHTHKPTSRPGR
jgi:hypothetical protein